MNTETNSTLAQRIESRINPAVTGQTGLTPGGAMAFNSVEQIMEFAKVMAIASVAIPKHLRENPGACLAVAIQACEWQMSPFAVANKSYVVNDRIGYEAQLVNAVILRRAPIKGRFKISYSGAGGTRKCKVAAVLTDGETVEYESPDFATIPTKNSPLWKGDPDQQLFYYSSRAMCRRHFPDVILGIYTADELADMLPEKEIGGREIHALPKIESATKPAEPANGSATQPVETPEAKEKRHRRTKAEIEAARATETTARQKPDESPTANDSGEPAAATEAGAVTPGPSDRDKLKMLVEEAGWNEGQAMHTLRKMRFALPNATVYGDLKDEVVADVLADPKTLIDGIAATFQ